MLLARALGEHHRARGESLGVVTPYKAQAEAVSKVLDESDTGAAIEVGTSYRFQGREFDVVVFDTLEQGGKQGWVAQGAPRPDESWRLDGLRLFTVGATRSSGRLYIVANAAAVAKARTGPLPHLRDLIRRSEAEVVRASQVLGLDEPAPRTGTRIGDDVQAALAPYVRVVDIHDQERVIDAVRARIDGARSCLWVWSPWVGRHSAVLQDALVAAQERGVEVRLIVLPDEAVTWPNRRALDGVRRRLAHVVTVHRMHQKIVVVDDRWSFVGSMNLLSHGPTPSRRRHDLMVEIESGPFAANLLHHEWADELARPPKCPRCRAGLADVQHFAGRRAGAASGWHWVCRSSHSDRSCDAKVPFATPGSRIDWSPARRR